MSPKVSVLVPLYNAEKYLAVCIDSILAQKFADIEIIVLDDGSTDGSLRTAKRYTDSRIIIASQPHGGIASARNRLLGMANGEYIYFVDADDNIEPDAIERLLNYAETYRLDLAICGRAGQGTDMTGIRVLNREQAVERFLTGTDIPSAMWTKLVRASLIRALEFDPRVDYGEDVMMTWRLLNKARRIGITDCRTYHYSDNPESITNSPFTDATYSLRLVWDTIVADTAVAGPALLTAARQKQYYCFSWLLYTALRSGTPLDHRVKTLLTHLRTNRRLLPASISSTRLRLLIRLATAAYTPLRHFLTPLRSSMPPLR